MIIGKVLTGDLMIDINNTEGEALINFYDVGIPGYTGELATQSERRLEAASAGLTPVAIINAISGYTKKLKVRVELEKGTELLRKVKLKFENTFFETHPLEEHKRNEFFYFCEEDENFVSICSSQSDLNILLFLEKKYQLFLDNLNN